MFEKEDSVVDFTTGANADECLRGLATIRRRALYLLICFLLIPVTFFAYALASSAGKAPWNETAQSSIGFGLMGLWGVSFVVHNWSRCPRCRKTFFIRRLYGNPLTRRCLNCGLLRSATTEEELAR